MDFVKNMEVKHVVGGGGREGVMLFISLWRIAYENRYAAQPLYLNPFVTIEKIEPRNYD